jgi:anti-sigma factor RsiW
MNDCQLEAVEAFFRGELEPTEAARVSAHVAVCLKCTEELHWLERERHFFQSRKGAYPPPPSFTEVLAATRTVSRPRRIAQSKKAAPKHSRWMIGGLGPSAPKAARSPKWSNRGFGLAAAFLLGAVAVIALRSPSPEVTADPRAPNMDEPNSVHWNECYACSPASAPQPPEPEPAMQSDDCEARTPSYVTFPVCGPQGDEDPPCP